MGQYPHTCLVMTVLLVYASVQTLFISSQAFINLRGLFDFGGCRCPCRSNTVKRCVHSYEESCYPNGYGETVCEKLPSISSKYVTERECQKCRELTDVEMGEGRCTVTQYRMRPAPPPIQHSVSTQHTAVHTT